MKNIIGISEENFCLILAGAFLLALGIYRAVPLKFDKSFWWQNGPLLLFLVIGATLLALRFQPGSGVKWGMATLAVAGKFFPLMILLCFIMSLGGILVGEKMYKTEATSFLLRHKNLAPVVGSVVAPTPNTFVGVIEGLWSEKKELTANFLFYLNAASVASLPLLMLRTAGFKTPEICTKMYLFGCITALLSFPIRYQITRVVDWLYTLW